MSSSAETSSWTPDYLHTGGLALRGEVVLRGKVHRLIGCESSIAKPNKEGTGVTFVVANGEASTVFIERFDSIYSELSLRHEAYPRITRRTKNSFVSKHKLHLRYRRAAIAEPFPTKLSHLGR